MDKFKKVGKLKAIADKEDEFDIYKMNCSAMNGEPSYEFLKHESMKSIGFLEIRWISWNPHQNPYFARKRGVGYRQV